MILWIKYSLCLTSYTCMAIIGDGEVDAQAEQLKSARYSNHSECIQMVCIIMTKHLELVSENRLLISYLYVCIIDRCMDQTVS